MPETDRDVSVDAGLATDSDVAADTAHFKAFATRRDDDPPPAWHLRSGGSRISVLAVATVVVALLAIILGTLLIS
jgi:hypothetical protein